MRPTVLRYDSSQKLSHSKKANSKNATLSRFEHYSVHGRKIGDGNQKSQENYQSGREDYQGEGSLLTGGLPVIRNRNRTVPMYLFYRGQKIVFQCEKDLSYGQLVFMLYREIGMYEINRILTKNKARIIELSIGNEDTLDNEMKNQLKNNLRNVLGFCTVCNNLKIDYLLSICDGKVEKSLLLDCFMDERSTGAGKGKKRQKYQSKFIEKQRFGKSKNKYQTFQKQALATKNSSAVPRKFNYQIYSCLAIGGFSKVYLARSYENGKFYAIKFIKKKPQQPSTTRQSVLNQMQLSVQFDHPFIIKMREGFETARFYCMVFQYCPGGELFYLLKRVKVMSQENARFYFIQILLGIKHMHEKNILYRDLKPENILIDRQGNLKIVDFGLSKKVQTNRDKTFSYCGSAEYMAPEMILRTGHNTGVDYYSLGALLYELVTGLPPFYCKNHQQLQKSIITQQLVFPSQIPLSQQIKDFLTHLLSKDDRHRLGSYSGIKQIIFHPWVGKFNPSSFLNKANSEQIPYPPDLSVHNFDVNQLGEDQEEFTKEVIQDVMERGCGVGGREDGKERFYVRSQAEGDNLHGYQTVLATVFGELEKEMDRKLEEMRISEKQATQDNEKKSKGHKNLITNNLRQLKIRTNHITSTNSSLKYACFPSSSPQKPRATNKTTHKNHGQYSIQQQNNISYTIPTPVHLHGKMGNIGERNEHILKEYKKLLPYFSKNKVKRGEWGEKGRGTLPKGNILRLKTIKNSLQEEHDNIVRIY